MKVLYIRTSTIEQNSERQRQNTEGNCKIIEDKCSGAVPFFERQGGKKILELTEKGIVGEINNLQMKVGGFEIQKHQTLHQVAEAQSKLIEFQNELEEEYGKVSVNIQDGTISAIEDE